MDRASNTPDADGANRVAVAARITGTVQGVWYRGWTARVARELGLDGWVRNRRDGSVEALFAGPADRVDAMLDQCWRGPSAARVTEVERLRTDDPGRTGFARRDTV